jgi:phosphoglycolate phosphatase-like HAD superfamily hydrolase
VPTSEAVGHVDASISVLRWPEEESLRQQLAWFGLPRLLLVERGTRPPELVDEMEDWLRTPTEPEDLQARSEVLRRRAGASSARQPVLDDDGLLWVGSAWVALTTTQVPVARLLLDNLNKVVRFEAVATSYDAAGGSRHPASVRTLLARLGGRVRTVGLDLVTIRRRGVILTAAGTAHRQI